MKKRSSVDYQIINNTIEGAFGGAVAGATSAAFTPANSGVAGVIIGAQTALPIDFFMSTLNNKYDIIKEPKPIPTIPVNFNNYLQSNLTDQIYQSQLLPKELRQK